MSRLFKTFSQIDSSLTKKYGGTGLGLVISKQLVGMMGGTLWVESKKGKGSTFYFTIESKPADSLMKKPASHAGTTQARVPLDILLVEDDAVSKTVASMMLQEKGYTVQTADNGRQALSLLEENNFDLILMDIQMPEMDGIETTRNIREKEAGTCGHIPIIALTAYALKGDRERFLSVGMDEYVTKPVNMDDLLHKLDKIMSSKTPCTPSSSCAVEFDGKGGFVFIGDTRNDLETSRRSILDEISSSIRLLESILERKNLTAIEAAAHKIKMLSNKIDADQIKTIAFKIELAARRGSLEDAVEYSLKIGQEFDSYRKSLI